MYSEWTPPCRFSKLAAYSPVQGWKRMFWSREDWTIRQNTWSALLWERGAGEFHVGLQVSCLGVQWQVFLLAGVGTFWFSGSGSKNYRRATDWPASLVVSGRGSSTSHYKDANVLITHTPSLSTCLHDVWMEWSPWRDTPIQTWCYLSSWAPIQGCKRMFLGMTKMPQQLKFWVLPMVGWQSQSGVCDAWSMQSQGYHHTLSSAEW